MTRDTPIESFKGRPGCERQKFSDFCAVCPFCGKINDMTRLGDTRCAHFVRELHASGPTTARRYSLRVRPE